MASPEANGHSLMPSLVYWPKAEGQQQQRSNGECIQMTQQPQEDAEALTTGVTSMTGRFKVNNIQENWVVER